MFQILYGISNAILDLLNEMSPYLLFGFFFAGILHVLFPIDAFARHLGKSGFWSVVKAVIFGIPLPLCSCGVIPSAILLRKRGASRGAILSFLVATPITGIDSIMATYSLMGLFFTVFRVIASSLTAIVTGVLGNLILPKEESVMHVHHYPPTSDDPQCCHDEAAKSSMKIHHRVGELFRYAFIELLGDVWKWLALGVIIGGMISYFVPESLIQRYLGGGIQSMVIMLVVGIPMYVCATGSIPIAAALMLKGMSPGAALVFLLAGPATNAVTFTVVAKELGKGAAVIYVSCIAVMSLLMGLALDLFWGKGSSLSLHAMAYGPMLPSWVSHSSTVLFLVLILVVFARKAGKGAGDKSCCHH